MNMKERGVNQGNAFGEDRGAQSGVFLTYDEQIQPLSPPVDAASVSPTTLDEKQSSPTVIFSPSMPSAPAALDSIPTFSQAEQEALSEDIQEPIFPDIATAESAGSLD